MQIINVSLNLKFKNNICSSSKLFGLYGAPAPLLFSNLITGKERILFLLNEGGGGGGGGGNFKLFVCSIGQNFN